MTSARVGDAESLLAAARRGERAPLARLLSMVERGGEASRAVARLAYRAPSPYTVGLTGAPGSGKSTITDRLIAAARRGWPDPDLDPAAGPGADAGTDSVTDSAAAPTANPGTDAATDAGTDSAADAGTDSGAGSEAIGQVGVLAVDPSSPFSGGAILGDRVRMQEHATDASVFIRSMSTRGHLGGLAFAVPDAVRVLGAAGLPVVLLETVGVGQMEVEVASAADTTVVVVTPGWGDAMQASKAGLLEVADLFVVNKADRPGVREARRDLEQMLDLSASTEWRPPVLETVASAGEGVAELWAAVADHRRFLKASGQLEVRRRDRLRHELRRALTARLALEADRLTSGERWSGLVRALTEGRIDPYEAVDRLMSHVPGSAGGSPG